jgi:hypothetical protein
VTEAPERYKLVELNDRVEQTVRSLKQRHVTVGRDEQSRQCCAL